MLDIFIILTCTILLDVFFRSYFSPCNVDLSLKKHISSTEISKRKPPLPHYLFPSPSPHLNSEIKNQKNEINQSITTNITTFTFHTSVKIFPLKPTKVLHIFIFKLTSCYLYFIQEKHWGKLIYKTYLSKNYLLAVHKLKLCA